MRTQHEKQQQNFCMVIELDNRKTFTRSTTPHTVGQNFCDTTANARSVYGS